MDKSCLEGKSITELLEICENREITGMDNQPKDILIQVILNDMVDSSEVPTKEDLEMKSITELRELCEDRDMVGLEKQPKNLLIQLLLNDYIEKAITKVKAEVTVEKGEDGAIDLTVTVSCGSSQSDFNGLVGKTVSDVAEFLRNALNIPDNPKCLVNGAEVNNDHVLQANDQLDFVQRTEKKGFLI